MQYSLFGQYTLTLNPYKFSVNLSVLQGFSLPTPALDGFNYIVPLINLYAYIPFNVGKFVGIYTSSIKTQAAQNRLYANEQILIGGRYAVRGFQGINLAGQFGVIWRNDISVYFPLFGKGKWQLTIAPSLGLDAGYIRDLLRSASSNLPYSGVFLSGGGIGMQCLYVILTYKHGGIFLCIAHIDSIHKAFSFLWLSTGNPQITFEYLL